MTSGGQPGHGMTVWALTGPIGAGKSAVSGILARQGAAIVDGDRLGHELLSRPDIQRGIAAGIGPEYVAGGVVDRRKLGARVFADPAALNELNRLTHGPLGTLAAQRLAALAAAGEHELAVFEAAVYFLLPSPPPVDLVVTVTAPRPLRIQRLVDRAAGGLSPAQAGARIAAQDDLVALWSRADQIIENDGTLDELETRVLRLLSQPRPGSENSP